MNCRIILVTGLAYATAAIYAVGCFGQSSPSSQATAPFVTHQLKPNVFWVEGGGGNSTVIVGDSGVIVVDAKTTKSGGQQLLDQIARLTPKPITTVILTHSDGDHVNGLAAFPAGVKVIAQENNKKEQEVALAAGGPGVPPADHLPTQTVSKPREMVTIEGEVLELYHWAPAHTSGDLVVYLPKYGIVATGDIIATNNSYPRIHDEKNGSTQGWITTANGIVAIDATIFVPGHGDVVTRADIQKRIADAVARRDQVKALASQGRSLEETKAAVGDTDKLNYKDWTQVCYEEMTRK